MRTEDGDDEVATDASTGTSRSSAAPQQEEQAGSSTAAATAATAAIDATPAETTATLVTTAGRSHSSNRSNLSGARPLRSLAARNRSSRSSRGPSSVVAPSVDSILDAKAVIIAASATALSTLHEGEEENDPEDPATNATEDPAAAEDVVPVQAQSPILLEDSKPRFTVIQVSNIQSQDTNSGDIKSDNEGSESHHDVERGDNIDAFPTLATAHMVTIPTISNISDHTTIQQERDRFRQQVRNEMLAAEMNAVQRAQPVEMASSRRESNKDGEGNALNDNSPVETARPKTTSATAPTTRPRRKRYSVHAGVALSVVTLLFIGAIASLWSWTAARQGNDPTKSASPTTTDAPINNSSTTSSPDDVVWLPDGRQAFTATAQLYRAVDDYDAALQANETAEGSLVAMQYGHPMGLWDVSRLTDFSKVFCVDREQKLEADVRLSARRTMDIPNLSGWNVSQATTMHGMFAGAVNWLADDDGLMDWDVGRVSDFSFMFGYAESWTGNSIASWNTSSATLMNSMFVRASKFNADLSRWDVARVSNMAYMMCEARIYTGGNGLNSWQVGQVRSMAYMLSNANAFIGSVSNWDTSSVETMKHMFFGASSFNGDLSRWNVERVTNMNSLFLGASAYQGGDLSNWNTGLVVDLYFVFGGCSSFNGNVSTWNVSNVKTFHGAFEHSGFAGDVSHWDVSAASNMHSMFKDALKFNSNVALWNTSKVTTMSDMFRNTNAFTNGGDLSSWDVSRVLDTSRMFRSADRFNTSLCKWQTKLPKDAVVTEMFNQTSCVNTSNPFLSLAAVEDAAVSLWSGPFCTPCPDDAGV